MKLFTSESVTEGHPDKICDQVSDAVLDAILAKDPQAHVACETFATTGVIQVMGEITTTCYVDIPAIVRDVVKSIGYDDPRCGFDGNTCAVLTAIDTQSPDIAMGVNQSLEAKNGETDENSLTGAGDQGMMFGYACDETPEYMPLAISLSHKLAKQLAQVRKDGTLSYLRPDGKTQVTVEYDGDQVKRIDAIVISAQHDEDVKLEKLKKDLIKYVIKPVVPSELVDKETRIFINPTGRFVIGGPVGDTRPHRPEDHRGHLRRLRPPRGRLLLRQGPHQGGPLRRLRRPLGGQEHRGRGPGPALRGGAGLRHRRGPARVHHGGHLRHRHGLRREAGPGRAAGL